MHFCDCGGDNKRQGHGRARTAFNETEARAELAPEPEAVAVVAAEAGAAAEEVRPTPANRAASGRSLGTSHQQCGVPSAAERSRSINSSIGPAV